MNTILVIASLNFFNDCVLDSEEKEMPIWGPKPRAERGYSYMLNVTGNVINITALKSQTIMTET